MEGHGFITLYIFIHEEVLPRCGPIHSEQVARRSGLEGNIPHEGLGVLKGGDHSFTPFLTFRAALMDISKYFSSHRHAFLLRIRSGELGIVSTWCPCSISSNTLGWVRSSQSMRMVRGWFVRPFISSLDYGTRSGQEPSQAPSTSQSASSAQGPHGKRAGLTPPYSPIQDSWGWDPNSRWSQSRAKAQVSSLPRMAGASILDPTRFTVSSDSRPHVSPTRPFDKSFRITWGCHTLTSNCFSNSVPLYHSANPADVPRTILGHAQATSASLISSLHSFSRSMGSSLMSNPISRGEPSSPPVSRIR